jgi:hypothetical protein
VTSALLLQPAVSDCQDVAFGRQEDRSDQRRAAISSRYAAIKSAEVTYRATSQSRSGSRHNSRQMGAKCRVENFHFGTLPEHLDLNHTIQWYDGVTLDVLNVSARYFETSRRNSKLPYMWKIRVDTYLTINGWWLDPNSAPPDDPTQSLFRPVRALLADQGTVVRQSTDEGFQECLVIERPKKDQTWIDPRLAFAVVRREIVVPRVRAACSEFVKIDDSTGTEFFFPKVIVINALGQNDKPLETRITMESLSINSLSPDDMACQLPPGTIIQDRDTQDRFQIPQGLEILDQNIDLAVQFRTEVQRLRQLQGQKKD